MLPYLAAPGQNNYKKLGELYLERLIKLHETHPAIYKAFQNGMYMIRRSNRFWAGLSTDLVIDQELMRCLQTAGGPTNGIGMTEVQRFLWVVSRPVCFSLNLPM